MHFVGTRYTKTQPDVSLSSGFTIERTFFLVHFKIVIFSEQFSAKSIKSKRLLITNQLLNVVLDTSSVLDTLYLKFHTMAPFLRLVVKILT